MGPQVLIIPALFAAICISFIILHSCYHRWKIGTLLKKKRDAAKVSIVNILQMTNPSLITPAWWVFNNYSYSRTFTLIHCQNVGFQECNIHFCKYRSTNCTVKSKIRPTVFVSEDSESKEAKEEANQLGKQNPNYLTSAFNLNGQQNLPPPCYEDLYGPGGAVFTFKSLTPEREEPPPFPTQVYLNNERSLGVTFASARNETHGNSSCPLHLPAHPTTMPVIPTQERRNSSAVLYL